MPVRKMFLSNNFISVSQDFSTFENKTPAPWFKKDINLSGDIKKAEITVCGLGFYELFLNDKRITKGFLSPYITNSDDVVFYDNYDITELIAVGKNEFKFLLGNGMQNAIGGYMWDFDKAGFRSLPKLSFAIEITYSNENFEIIEADETVAVKASKIIFNDLRLGETYDCTFDAGEWKNAVFTSPPLGEKKLSIAKPILVRDEIKPISIWKEDNSYIYDFGINTAGVCRININAAQGRKIVLTFGETLQNGKFSIRNTTFNDIADRYFQRDTYVCRDGENIWQPTFTYHGFRYVKVDGIKSKQATNDLLTFVVFNTFLDEKGSFECDDNNINKLNNMSLNSTLSNFHHIPTDCPHREKNGWTGDAALSASHTLLYFEPTDNYKQWLFEICKSQNEQGAIPGIVPTGGWGFEWGNGPAWDCVLTELPYQIWQKRNDLSSFIECKNNILKYIKYIETRLDENGLIAIGLGDWCAPHGDPKAPLILTDSIEVYDITHKAGIMFLAAGEIDNSDYCLNFAENIRKNIRKQFLDRDTCTLAKPCQTSQAMGIFYKIFNDDELDKAMKVLMCEIEKSDYHIDTGILGGRVLFNVLAENGEMDTAIKIMKNPTKPSYMQWVLNGDTALCESFEESDGISSHNHHFWGNISAFFMEQICGIKVNADKINIAPHFPSNMNFAKAEFYSAFGKVSVMWKRINDKIIFNLDYPNEAKGKLVLKRNAEINAESGEYII